MNLKAISVNVGRALLVSALFMFLSVIVSIIDGMDSAFGPLLISALVTLIVGAFPFIFVKEAQAISLKDGFLTVVLAWMLSFIFGMLPYVLWGGEFSIVNALFESVSGFTTSGGTILTDVEALPRSLLFWRSSTHFIGGLGVVVFLLLVIPESSPFRLRLTNIEMSSLSKEGYRFRSSKKVYVIMAVYVGMNIAATLSLWAAGMSFFDAINHAFSLIATGGFSTHNASIAHFDSNVINLICTLFMLLAATHFGILFSAVVSRSIKPFNNGIIKFFYTTFLIVTVLITVFLKYEGSTRSWGQTLVDAAFQTASFITTTGFCSTDTSGWPIFAVALLLYCGFQCGCSGSTTGGLKSDRVIILFKAMGLQIRRYLYPNSVSNIKVGNHHVKDEDVMSVFQFTVLFCSCLVIMVLLLMSIGVNTMDAFSGSLASLSNLGLAFGSISSTYSAQPMMAKLIYIGGMVLGRVEIYPVLIVISMIFSRKK